MGGVEGGFPAPVVLPVVLPDSSSILEASSCTFANSSASLAIVGKGFDAGEDPWGC